MDADEVELPDDTLKILNEFLEEKAQRERNELENIQNNSGKDVAFEEDWQLSQFWYNAETKYALADVVKQLVQNQSQSYEIALLSSPSLYPAVKDVHDNVKIYEYDRRFAAFGEGFVHYDFNEADACPERLREYSARYDLIIADPPFLSEECITKISKIILYLLKPNGKIIFCSGEVVETWLERCLDLKKCKFEPKHERNLGNKFASYANFDLDNLIKSQVIS